MELFIVENGVVIPNPQTLLLEPFTKIWESDNSTKKEIAMPKLAYIEFMCSYKKSNPFVGYTDKVVRRTKILESLPIESEQIRTDSNIQDAIDLYFQLQQEASPSLKFYQSAVGASEKMIEFFNDFDLLAVNQKSGSLLYKPADITRALKDVNEILKTMTSLKQNVYQELYEDSKGKGGREINYFEK